MTDASGGVGGERMTGERATEPDRTDDERATENDRTGVKA